MKNVLESNINVQVSKKFEIFLKERKLTIQISKNNLRQYYYYFCSRLATCLMKTFFEIPFTTFHKIAKNQDYLLLKKDIKLNLSR